MDKVAYMATAEYRLGAIQRAFDRHGITFSKREAAKLLGGQARLMRLIEAGEIRVLRHGNVRDNARWKCCGGDVLRNMAL